ncbi:MAG TPA: hypothetical protein VMU29_09285 [Smithella sp.]|nr:hypothetical protein [Smithella sp.]
MEEISSITALGLAFLVIMGLLIFFLPRRLVFLPFIITVSYMTLGQQVIIAGLHFDICRILLQFGLIRLLIRREVKKFDFTIIDKLIIALSAASVITATMLTPTMDTFINRMGWAYDTLLAFFLFRFLVRNMDEIIFMIKITAIVILPLALSMIIEKSTQRNIFYIYGVAPEFTIIREGRLRCQGPFRHPILAGTFGATLFPLFFALWNKQTKGRAFAYIGIISSTIITVMSASSGPLMAYLAALIGLFFWPLRDKMRVVRWALLTGIAMLAVFMKAPIWFLISRLSEITGGTGEARSLVIDQAVKHVSEWWLLGTTYTAHWAADNGLITLPHDPDNIDITNQYIFIGVQGGILPLILFILIIWYCFQELGKTRHMLTVQSSYKQFIPWALGCALFAHAVTFISVVYFDQMRLMWAFLLSIIAFVASLSIKKKNQKCYYDQ